MNIVICGVTGSPSPLPIYGPCEVVPPLSRAQCACATCGHCRDHRRLPLFLYFPPKRAPGAGICETHLGINGIWLIAEFNV